MVIDKLLLSQLGSREGDAQLLYFLLERLGTRRRERLHALGRRAVLMLVPVLVLGAITLVLLMLVQLAC